MTQYPLKGRHVTYDPRLDCIPSEDPRRLDYPVGLGAVPLPGVKKSHGFPTTAVLDQGREGACTGFAVAHDIACAPAAHKTVTDAYARQVYRWNQRNDEWAGESYEGSSVNASMKFLKAHGFITDYRWTWSVEEIATIIVTKGPVCVGVEWFEGMYWPGADLLLKAAGRVVGRHAYILRGYSPAGVAWTLPDRTERLFPFPTFRMRNSWGADWGANGDAFIAVDTFAMLMARGGDAAVPFGRKILVDLPAVAG